MAETSLARQLRKLAAPQTSLLKESKLRASFLFDPKEAASLDVDTVYAIGTTGLEELIYINEKFLDFEHSLFGETSKFLERAMKTKEENRELDEIIEEFLLLLSPYFLLRPSHKALEWLVYRFRIHSYNVDAFLGCIFPFHETRYFARAVQLFDLSDATSKWHWLMPLQKPGIPLPKTTLLNHCWKDLGFLRFICNLLISQIKCHNGSAPSLRPVVGFYISSMVGALEFADSVGNNMIGALLPFVLEGLDSDVVDYVAATYMVLSQLARRTVLEKEFLKEVIVRIVKTLKPECFTDGLLCLLVILNYQKMTSLPKRAFQSLVKQHSQLATSIEELAQRHSVLPLIQPLLSQLIGSALAGGDAEAKGSNKRGMQLFHRLLPLALASDEGAHFVVECFFQGYIDLHRTATENGDTGSSLVEGALELLKSLWQRGPDHVDACLERWLHGDDDDAKQAIQLLTRSNLFSAEHVLLAESGEALFLALNSSSKRTRVEAVCELVKMIQRGESLKEDFIKDSLLARLHDDDCDVVRVVLGLGEELCKYVEPDAMLQLFRMRRLQMHQAQSMQLCCAILTFLCDVIHDMLPSRHLLALVLSHLLPVTKDGCSFAKFVLTSRGVTTLPVLKCLLTKPILAEATKLLDKENVHDFVTLVINETSKAVVDLSDAKDLVSQLISIASSSESAEFVSLKCFAAHLLRELLPRTGDTEIFLQVLEFYRHLLRDKPFTNKSAKAPDDVEDMVNALQEGKLPESLLVAGLGVLVESIEPVCALEERPGWSLELDKNCKPELELLGRVFGVLADEAARKSKKKKSYRELIQKFFEVQMQSLKSQLHFLARFWMPHLSGNRNGEAVKLQSQSLAVAAQLLHASVGTKLDWLLAEQSPVFLSILLSLLSPFEEIRKLGVSAMGGATAASRSSKSGFASLAGAILKHSAEVTTDCECLFGLVAKWHKSLKKPSGLVRLLIHSDTPVHIRAGILRLCRDVYSKDVLEAAVHLLMPLVRGQPEEALDWLNTEIVQACFSKYTDEASASDLSVVDGALDVLEKAVRCTRPCKRHESVATIALRTVDKHLVRSLPAERQTSLTDALVELALISVEPEHKAVLRALRKVCSIGSLVAQQLKKNEPKSPVKTVRDAKKMRLSSATHESDPLDSPFWRRVLVILEQIQCKKSIEDVDLLVGPLYFLLKRSFELGNFSGVEYLRQSILSCLHGHRLAAPRHEVALLVKCLRLAHSPHTQQLVLSLLNLSATECPEEVLHNVTSVFTFMGASLLRQDDDYSFQMVIRTVDTVVPALLQACGKESDRDGTSANTIAQVTRVFVDAYEDIPEHRRLPVFVKLVSTLDPAGFLWILLAQMVEHSICKLLPDANDQSSTSPSAILDFGLLLCASFKVVVQVNTCTKLLEFASSFPALKEHSKKPCKHPEVFRVDKRPEKQLQRFRLTTASFVSNLLASSNFLSQVAELQHVGDESVDLLYQECLSVSLQFVQKVTCWVQSHATSPCIKTWKQLLIRLHDIVHKVNGLLPSGQFISIVKSLMKHGLPSLRRNAMDMLNAKLSAEGYFNSSNDEALLSLLKQLSNTSLGKWSFADETSSQQTAEEILLNRQTALLSIKLLLRHMGQAHPDSFAEVYGVVVKLMMAEDLHPALLSSSLLCLAELCRAMPVPTIPHLSRLMPPFLDILQREDRSEIVTLGLVTALHRLVEHLSPFLSSYLAVIITEVCCMCATHCTETSQPTTIQQRLSAVCMRLGQLVPARVIVPALEDSFPSLSSAAAVKHLVAIFNSLIASVDKAELQGHLPQLQNLVLLLLDYRHENKDLEFEELNAAENDIVSGVTSLSFKLSEVTFRPFFYRIFSWATISEDESERDRVITFYHLTERLAEALKSLFVLFAGQFVKHAATVLVATHKGKRDAPYYEDDEASCQLLRYVLCTLSSCFQHGGKMFLTRERTNVLTEPLVDQVENMLGDDDEVQSRVEGNLVPCLAYFALGCDDAARKEWHHKLLIKMRNPSAKVRYAALQVFRESIRKLGDDYLVLLPEAVPFLAELMEDDSTEVEQLCQEVILEVEQVLGEPLMKYF